MAFLDNSGDIILDAVLTDAGRQRLARGEFRIVKFALSDEEIDYSTYNGSHASGSAFADLEIMQTPILEAFTNNTSLMKTKLVSINRNNILHLPIFRLNTQSQLRGSQHPGEIYSESTDSGFGGFYVSADPTTDDKATLTTAGIIPNQVGNNAFVAKTKRIVIDQGMDTGGTPSRSEPMPQDLVETAFLIRIDHRLLRLHSGTLNSGYTPLANSFVDDDAIASYYISSLDEPVSNIEQYPPEDVSQGDSQEMFDGPLGKRLGLMVKSTVGLQSSDALFDELGTTLTNPGGFAAATYKTIDTTLNVVGVTTGYSIDIPIKIIRFSS
tara:strand:+ start:4554 stop:5528 length:975 start_codon:yes stop_codon:yes gene_type:complete